MDRGLDDPAETSRGYGARPGLIQVAGPFLDPWREADRAAQRARRFDEQQARLDELDAIEAHVEQLRERLPPGAVIIGGAGDTRPADALRRLGARLNCEVVIIPSAGHDPWLEAPGQFGAVLRAAVKRCSVPQ